MIRKYLRWFILLNKRMLKKRGFLAILCMIPLFLAGADHMAQEDSGVLRIALCKETEADAFADTIMQELEGQSEVIHYILVENEAEGTRLVQRGEADALWIFPENMEEKVEAYATGELRTGGWIRVIEKEENVALQLTRELLYGKLYDSISYPLYKAYITQRLLPEETIEESVLREAYKEIDVSDNIFVYGQLEGEASSIQQSYLLMPIRGMLSLLVLLAGLTFSLYYIQDEGNGCFTWLSASCSPIRVWLYQLPGLLDIAAVVLIGMKMVGSFTEWKRELWLMGLYLMMIMGFCDILRRLCRRIAVLGSMIPILMLLSLALCPIFVKITSMKPIQLLLPPYHYLNALYNEQYMWSMIRYIGIAFFMDAGLKMFERWRKIN